MSRRCSSPAPLARQRHPMNADGDQRIQALARTDVERLKGEMLSEGKSGRAIGLMLTLLRAVPAEAPA